MLYYLIFLRIIFKYCCHSFKSVHLSSSLQIKGCKWRSLFCQLLGLVWLGARVPLNRTLLLLHLSHLTLLSLVCENSLSFTKTFLFNFRTCYLENWLASYIAINIINICNSKGLFKCRGHLSDRFCGLTLAIY